MNKELSVLFLARFFLSGQTTHVVSLARTLNAMTGVKVSVATMGTMHPQAWINYSRLLRESGIQSFQASTVAQLTQFVRQQNPTVLHTHSSDLIPIALDLTHSLGSTSVFTCHGLGAAPRQPRIQEMDAVIAPGPRVKNELRDLGLKKVYVIGNGVDLDHFRPHPKEKPLKVVFLGRMDTKKRRGLHELVRACERLHPVRLVVASNDRPSTLDSANALGWVDDPAPLLGRSHAVFGTGRALREGMASGCVAFVLGEKYGGMVSPENRGRDHALPCFSGLTGNLPSAEEMRTDLVRLFQDEKKLHQLASWSRRYAISHFCLKTVAQQTLHIYQKAGEPE